MEEVQVLTETSHAYIVCMLKIDFKLKNMYKLRLSRCPEAFEGHGTFGLQKIWFPGISVSKNRMNSFGSRKQKQIFVPGNFTSQCEMKSSKTVVTCDALKRYTSTAVQNYS